MLARAEQFRLLHTQTKHLLNICCLVCDPLLSLGKVVPKVFSGKLVNKTIEIYNLVDIYYDESKLQLKILL